MCKKKSALFLRLLFGAATLCCGTIPGIAQQSPGATPGKVPGKNPGETIITDAAGRKHVYHARITDAQRKAVAVRMNKARAAAKKGQVK